MSKMIKLEIKTRGRGKNFSLRSELRIPVTCLTKFKYKPFTINNFIFLFRKEGQ